jgi:hypothetical protein
MQRIAAGDDYQGNASQKEPNPLCSRQQDQQQNHENQKQINS